MLNENVFHPHVIKNKFLRLQTSVWVDSCANDHTVEVRIWSEITQKIIKQEKWNGVLDSLLHSIKGKYIRDVASSSGRSPLGACRRGEWNGDCKSVSRVSIAALPIRQEPLPAGKRLCWPFSPSFISSLRLPQLQINHMFFFFLSLESRIYFFTYWM